MWPPLLALVFFTLAAWGMAAAASRIFGPVTRTILLLLIAAVCVYMLAVPATGEGPSLTAARAQILAGHVPLWDGEPLLANPGLALAHPFTLLACLAGTNQLTVALRLLAALLFAFILFRAWGVGDAAALFGAIGYAFCTTHIVAPSALTLATLPLALAATQELVRARRARSLAALTVALTLTVLGGDLPMAIRVAIAVVGYVIFRSRSTRLFLATAVSLAFAAGLTAFFWMPVRDAAPHAVLAGSTWTWSHLLPFLAPNVLGMTGPGYAGIIPLVLAPIGLLRSDRREKWFFLGIALLGFWPLSIAALAVLGVCALARDAVSPRALRFAAGCVAFALLTLWFARAEYLDPAFVWTYSLTSFIVLALFVLLACEWRILPAVLAAVLTFGELTIAARQAKPAPTHFANARYARLRDEAKNELIRFAKTPPAFAVSRYRVQAEIGDVIPRLQTITDFQAVAIVHDVPPSLTEDAPQLAHGSVSAPRTVRIRQQNMRELSIDVGPASGWSLLATHQIDWPGWRGYWNGSRLPVVTVDGAFSGAFVPPQAGTLVLRYWPAPFIDGVRISVSCLILFVIALALGGRWVRNRRSVAP
jgi:hypothetical protein